MAWAGCFAASGCSTYDLDKLSSGGNSGGGGDAGAGGSVTTSNANGGSAGEGGTGGADPGPVGGNAGSLGTMDDGSVADGAGEPRSLTEAREALRWAAAPEPGAARA